MKPFRWLLLAFVATPTPIAFAEDQTFRVELPLKTPRSREPVLGGSKEKIFVNLWIPDGVKVVRGAVCNPFSKDEPVSKHWQAACRHWGFAYVQIDLDGVKKDDYGLLFQGLTDLATKSRHAEVEHMPFCWIGMSRGGGQSMQLTEMVPARTIACVPVCLEVGPSTDAGRHVPIVTVFGEKDGSQMKLLLAKLPVERKQDARWGVAVQWNRKHEFALANNMAFVLMDEAIAKRLPKETPTDKAPSLGEIPVADGWVGDVSTWGKDGRLPVIQPAKDFKGDVEKSCWFPSHRVAAVWQAFVGGTKEVTISEPPGLGDGQPFVLQSSKKPVTVKLNLVAKEKPAKVELWDADVKLAEKTEGPWEFEVPLKPGIHSLIATVGEGESRRCSRPHTIVVE